MPQERKVKVTVCGSMNKYWNEMRRVIEEFKDLGADVLSPPLEDFVIPLKSGIYIPTRFRPLRSEVGLSIKQIENNHLNALRRSDLGYFVIPDGILGDSTSLEFGFGLEFNKKMYFSHPVNLHQEGDFGFSKRISEYPVKSPSEVVREFN